MSDWRNELGKIIQGKGSTTRAEQEHAEFEAFLNETALPALQQLAAELEQHGRDCSIREAPASAVLTVRKDGLEEIVFRVIKRYVSSGIIPYAEVRVARGTRYAKYDVFFKTPPVSSVAEVTTRDIIAAFLKAYKTLHEGELRPTSRTLTPPHDEQP